MALSKAQMRSIEEYKKRTYDRLSIRIRKDSTPNKNDIQSEATKVGESTNEYILKAIKLRMDSSK